MAKQQVREKRYWDSNCFLEWLSGDPNKRAALTQVLRQADHGDIRIVTSAFTLAEVLVMRGHPKILKTERQRMRNFFHNSYIQLVPVYQKEGEFAQDLVWDHGVKPKDAIHLASAISAEVNLFNTYDKQLLNKNGLVAFGHKFTIQQP